MKKHSARARKWGSLNFGGAIVTAGNCIFVAGSLDGNFRAFDRRTGATLWEYALPAGGQATPMTYSLDGKQYVVIAAAVVAQYGLTADTKKIVLALEPGEQLPLARCETPHVYQALTNFVSYGSPNKAATPFINKDILNNPLIYPPADVLAMLPQPL